MRLSKDEFEACFKTREQDLEVREENKAIIISTKEGLVCPNLGEKGCRIYHDRPLDCRLYPYQMLPAYETRQKVKIVLYLKSVCVANHIFNVPEAEARSIAEAYGRNVYGDKKIIVQVFEDRFLFKLRNKCEVMIVKLLLSLGFEL